MIQETRLLMGMPITVTIVDSTAAQKDIDGVFDYFQDIDNRFSTYKKESEISKINKGEIDIKNVSLQVQEVFQLAEQTKKETNGYFDISYQGRYDPSGLVKGWAIYQTAKFLWDKGYKSFYIEAGGDIQVSGGNEKGETWTVGIKNPFNQKEIVKVLQIDNKGVATSGTYIRGNHIYNPVKNGKVTDQIVSITVIGPNIYEADRFATAAFAMGEKGIKFISSLSGFEGYMINKEGIATYTRGFEDYVI